MGSVRQEELPPRAHTIIAPFSCQHFLSVHQSWGRRGIKLYVITYFAALQESVYHRLSLPPLFALKEGSVAAFAVIVLVDIRVVVVAVIFFFFSFFSGFRCASGVSTHDLSPDLLLLLPDFHGVAAG
ncbi:unnamed protein product [Sphagnum compactum]